MKLYRLKLKNFKGIKDFTLDVAGQNAKIFGDNAVGKTSLFDAFTWLMFDKDSTGKKDFAIKTIDASGNEIHMLEHEVEGVLDVDGKLINLRKVYKEKWTKKKGNPTPEFTGHETDYFIEGVPVKKSEYLAKINEIANEEAFKLLTSPSYFNEQLHWEKRRKIILGVCGDISDAEVIDSNKKLAKLPDILGDRKLDDHKKVIAARKAELNKEIETIPIRVSEVQRGLPDVSGLNEMDICYKISVEKENLKKANETLLQLQSGGKVAQKKIQLTTIEAELQKMRNEHQTQIDKQINVKTKALNELNITLDISKRKINQLNSDIVLNKTKITNNRNAADSLRIKWHNINSEELEIDLNTVCPTCGQDLPEDKLADARAKAESNFNLEKSKRLTEVSTQGKVYMAEVDELEKKNTEIETEIDVLKSQLTQGNDGVAKLTEEINIITQSDGLSTHPPYIDLLKKKSTLEQSITEVNQDNSEVIAEAKQKVSEVETKIAELDNSLAQIKQSEAGQKRIAELKDQEKKLAAEYGKLESELFLAEEFIRTKVSMLEEKINGKFKYARFKLFETQVNGGLSEVCDTLFNGVPYGSGLNNAARINVGLDIINTLSQHYGFTAPIFVDNAEAVTELIDTDAQVISLVVSEKDKELRVELENKSNAEVM